MCHKNGIEPQFENIIKNGPFIPVIAGQKKPKGQWTTDERKATNLDQRLKSLIMSVLPDDQMNYVINCLTAKLTWDDLILYHEGPFDVKESRVMDLKLCYNTFKFKKGESLTQTFTRYNALMNELVNDDIKLSKLEINTGFINGLTNKWLSFCQSLFDFQDSPDDEEDTRSSHKYLNDLEEEYQARSLLAKSKRFFNKVSKASMVKNKGLIAEDYEWDKEEVSSDANEMVEVKGSHGPIDLLNILALTHHRIIPSESQRNTTDSSVAVTESSAIDYDLADESSVCSIPLPPLKKLNGAEPISGPKTIKLILKSKSTFKAEALKDVTINEPSSAHAKGNKSSSASKVDPTPAGKLKSVKIKDDPPLAIFDEKRGTIFNSNKEGVLIAPRHKRLAHLNFKTINKLEKQNLVLGLPSLVYSKDKPCSACEKGKHHEARFKTKQTSTIKKCLHLLHMDLFGPITPRSINHEKYTLVIINEYSRYTWVYFLKKKSQAPETIMSFLKRVKNQNDIKVKQLRTDNGTQFRNNILVSLCDEKGISQIFSSPYIPKQNGVVERKNRTLIEAVRIMLSGSVFSKQYWTEAVATACYTQNRVFNTRRQQIKETYHITFDESPYAIKFLKSSVDNINIAKTKRYSPDEYLYPYEPSKRYQTNKNDLSFIEPYESPEPVVLEIEVSFDQNGQADQNDQSVLNDEILNDDHSEYSNHTNDE
nr:ribonuclease H-like domain-containing protein [Tanacetum cinerariifolium]